MKKTEEEKLTDAVKEMREVRELGEQIREHEQYDLLRVLRSKIGDVSRMTIAAPWVVGYLALSRDELEVLYGLLDEKVEHLKAVT